MSEGASTLNVRRLRGTLVSGELIAWFGWWLGPAVGEQEIRNAYSCEGKRQERTAVLLFAAADAAVV